MKSLSFENSFATVATLAVLAGIVAGFWVLGSPNRQRSIGADQRRLSNLQETARTLYWRAQDQDDNYTLPDTLNTSELGRDPITQEPYEYNRLSDSTYELCAEFETDSSTYPLRNQSLEDAEHWAHAEGRHCFEFDTSEQPPPFY